MGSTVRVVLDENGNAVRLQGVGRRSFEVIEDELAPLVAGCFGEQFLIFLDAGVTDQDGIRVINHVISEAEAFGGEVFDFRGRGAAVGALGSPFNRILAVGEAFAAFLQEGIVFGHFAEAPLGFFRKGFHRVLLAGLANRKFKNTLGSPESLVDYVGLIEFIEPPVAGKAALERSIVLKRMKVWRNLTHAQECPEGVTNPTFFGTGSDG